MKIERINHYNDTRFNQEVLNQHGAFLINDTYPCQFKIISENEAIIYYHDYTNIDEIIEEFLFYTGHIHIFYDKDKNLIKERPSKQIFKCRIDEIQPSQFYIDKDKLQAISTFIHKQGNIIIPICKIDNQYISLDGHTRLYYAYTQNYQTIQVYYDEYDSYIKEFVKEAKKKNIYHVSDMKLLDHKQYDIEWNQFCDDFFKLKTEN